MAEAAATKVPETITATESENPPTQDMDLETPNTVADETPRDAAAADDGGEANPKREREEGEETEEESGGGKKQKAETSAEEERQEKAGGADDDNESGRVTVGPKSFGSSVEMFDYFYKLLHSWPPNLNANKYEHMVLLDLLKKGHLESDKKIGGGIAAFQVRYHPQWKSRCFFLLRNDESVDDFSFRKCVDHILPLPENMQIKSDVNKALGGGGRGHRGKSGGGGGGGGRRGGHGHGHGRGRGRGRGGKSRN